jgi:hypothetical protein
MLVWVNNDTYEQISCPLLDAPFLPFTPNQVYFLCLFAQWLYNNNK